MAAETTQEMIRIGRKERIRMDVSVPAAESSRCVIRKDGAGNTSVASFGSGRAASAVKTPAGGRVKSVAREKSG
jgi:hypothetical protein